VDWGTHVPFRVSNAAPHVGRAVVINLDLKDFFPSITFRRVKGLFHALGYAEHPATLLAWLRTEPPRVAAGWDGKSYRVALGKRALPQGVCTSLAIINALCRRLDRRLVGLARRHGFTSTHYADDLTFSGDADRAVGRLLRSVRAILIAAGLTEHPRKTSVMRRASRQEGPASRSTIVPRSRGPRFAPSVRSCITWPATGSRPRTARVGATSPPSSRVASRTSAWSILAAPQNSGPLSIGGSPGAVDGMKSHTQ